DDGLPQWTGLHHVLGVVAVLRLASTVDGKGHDIHQSDHGDLLGPGSSSSAAAAGRSMASRRGCRTPRRDYRPHDHAAIVTSMDAAGRLIARRIGGRLPGRAEMSVDSAA